jgi:Bacterial regulatory proteins, luxR family
VKKTPASFSRPERTPGVSFDDSTVCLAAVSSGYKKLSDNLQDLWGRVYGYLNNLGINSPKGSSDEEIGKKIIISRKTVKTHLRNIFDKLQVHNRFKAALCVMSRDSAPR